MKSKHTITVEVDWDTIGHASAPRVSPSSHRPEGFRDGDYTAIPLHQLTFLGITKPSVPPFKVGDIIASNDGIVRIITGTIDLADGTTRPCLRMPYKEYASTPPWSNLEGWKKIGERTP